MHIPPQDIENFRARVLSSSDYCPEIWEFYYDETRNFQSLRAGKVLETNSDGSVSVSDSLKKNFVLGGIVLTDDASREVLREAFRKANFPTRTDKWSGKQEVKFKTVFGKGDFLKCIENRHASSVFDLLNIQGVFVHIHSMNAFYYAVSSEITYKLVSILGRDDKGIDYRECLPQLQDMLYNLVCGSKAWYMQQLFDNGYPDMTRARDIKNFCDNVSKFIDKNPDDILYGFPIKSDPGAWYETSRVIRHVAMKCMLLGDTDDDRLRLGTGTNWVVDSLAEFYWEPCYLWFPNALHVIDGEPVIEDQVKELFPGGLMNCIFKNSPDEDLIQLSDVWVGLFAKFEDFLDGIVFERLLPSYEINPQNICSEDSLKRAVAIARLKKRKIERSFVGPDDIKRRRQAFEHLTDSLEKEIQEINDLVTRPDFSNAVKRVINEISSSLGVLGKDNIRNLAKTVIKAYEKSQYLIRVEGSSQLTALRLELLNALSVMK